MTNRPQQQNQISIRSSQGLRDAIASQALLSVITSEEERMRMTEIIVNCFRANPKLADCTQASVFKAIRQSASLRLPVDGVLGFAYLVPYKAECTLIPGYKGYIQLCRRSGEISEIHMEAVYQSDTFSYTKGLNPSLTHVPSETNDQTNDAEITHVYVVVKLKDGGAQFDVWPRARVEGHAKKYSAAYRAGKKDSPWFTNWKEMAMKTVFRYMVNRGIIPLSTEARTLAAHDELIDHDSVHGHAVISTQAENMKQVQNLAQLTQHLAGPKPEASFADDTQQESGGDHTDEYVQESPPDDVSQEQEQSVEPDFALWDKIEMAYAEAMGTGGSLDAIKAAYLPTMGAADKDMLKKLHDKYVYKRDRENVAKRQAADKAGKAGKQPAQGKLLETAPDGAQH